VDKDRIPPGPNPEKTLPTIYTQQELGTILGGAGDYLRLVLELALKCGLRDQELMHLEWGDIHHEDATLRVTSKPHWKFKIKDSEERDIPVPTDLLDRLADWRTKHPKTKLVIGTKSDKPNGKLLRTLKRTAKRLELNCGACEGCKSTNAECQQWTLHKFRRTYCTGLLRNNFDLRTVQHFMGHADLASTMRYLRPATGKESQGRINAIQWTS